MVFLGIDAFFHVATNSRWWKKYFLSYHYQLFRNIQPFFCTHIASPYILYIAPTNEYSCGWVVRACGAFFCVSLCYSYVCIFHIHNINFTFKTPFLSTLTTVFLVFLSTCHDNLVFCKPFSFHLPHPIANVYMWSTQQHSMLISFMFVYH